MQVLDLFDKGYTSPTIAEYAGVTEETVRRIGWNYKEGGFEGALSEKEASQIIAMVCTDPDDTSCNG